MAELANEGSKLISVIFCPDDLQPVSQEQPATTLVVPVSADPPLKTVPTSSPTSSPTSAPDLMGEIPAVVMENVAVLTWPNENAPGGISTVYLVGTAHVSKVRKVGCGESGKSGKSSKSGKSDKRVIKGRGSDNAKIGNRGSKCVRCKLLKHPCGIWSRIYI